MTSGSISTCLLYKAEKFSQKSQVDFLFFSLVQIRSHDYLWEILYLVILFLKLEAARAKRGPEMACVGKQHCLPEKPSQRNHKTFE